MLKLNDVIYSIHAWCTHWKEWRRNMFMSIQRLLLISCRNRPRWVIFIRKGVKENLYECIVAVTAKRHEKLFWISETISENVISETLTWEIRNFRTPNIQTYCTACFDIRKKSSSWNPKQLNFRISESLLLLLMLFFLISHTEIW